MSKNSTVFKYKADEQEKLNRELSSFNETELVLRFLDIQDLNLLPIFQKSQLLKLDMEQSKLDFLHPDIQHLTHLTHLYLSDNRMISLPKTITALTCLKVIRLDNNNLPELPNHLLSLTNLEELSANNNKITSILPQIGNLTKMTKLYLSGNQISSLPSEFKACTHLQELDLSSNPLRAFPSTILLFPNLQVLQLNCVGISSLSPSFCNLTSLTSLGLNGNLLVSLPEQFGQLTKLKDLGLSSNQLKDIGASFHELKSLKTLKLYENPELPAPIQKIMKGKNQVLQKTELKKLFEHLEKLEKPKRWKSVKLLMVGPSATGKTTLNLSLEKKKASLRIREATLNQGLPKTSSTSGIEIKKITIGGVEFLSYDFGGKEIFYPTHTFFLTSDSIYLVVFDLSKPLVSEKLEYWLNKIKYITSSKEVSIVIVGTHADKLGENDLSLSRAESQVREWKKIFPDIVDFFAVSCLTQQGIERLSKRLVSLVQEKNMTNVQVPSWYSEVNSQIAPFIRGMEIPIIPFSDFVAWSKTGSEERAIRGANFLHQKGVLVYFPKTDFVILDPQWLAKVMTSIILSQETWAPRGILKHADLPNVWKSISPNSRIYPFLLNVLERFELLFPLRATEASLVPCLLPIQFPTDLAWKPFPSEDIEQLDRVFKFSPLIPYGFFGRLIHRLLYNNEDLQDSAVFWGSGLFIDYQLEQIQWLVLCVPQKNEISVILRRKRIISSENCSRCVEKKSSLYCQTCRNSFCGICSLELHSTGKWQTHPLKPYAESTDQAQKNRCLDSLVNLCEKVEVLAATYSGVSISTHVSCSTCIKAKVLRPPTFPVAQVLEKKSLQCPKHPSVPVLPRDIIPDLLLHDLFIIPDEQIQITSTIAEGGFGLVYKGLWKDRDVAVKELKESQNHDINNFKREMRITSKLTHPNLVTLFGVTVTPKLRMIMEYAPGGDLLHKFHHFVPSLEERKEKCLVRERRLSEERKSFFTDEISSLSPEEKKQRIAYFQKEDLEIERIKEQVNLAQDQLDSENISWSLRVKVALDIAYGMRYLHNAFQEPIVHRDLRSPNIFLVSMDEKSPINAKVGDLGLSQVAGPQLSEMLLNWEYMGPEIYDSYDERLDIYSFGILLWEITTNLAEKPFLEYQKKGIKESTLKQKIITEHLRPSIRTDTPDSISQLIRKCWNGNPNDRPDFGEICEALESFLIKCDNGISVRQVRNSRHGSIVQRTPTAWLTPLTQHNQRATKQRKLLFSMSSKHISNLIDSIPFNHSSDTPTSENN